MQHATFTKTLAFAFALAVSAIGFTNKPGGDVYEIHLNNKLLLKQFVHQPFSLKALSLANAKANDQLTIYYSHCGVTGKGRSITVKDDKGTTLKKWNFADAKGASTGMTIAVKELLQLEKENGEAPLTLTYAAQELPEGRTLAALRFTQKNTAYHPRKEATPVLAAGNLLWLAL